MDGCHWTGFKPSILQLVMSQMAASEQALSQALFPLLTPPAGAKLVTVYGGFKKKSIKGNEGRRKIYIVKITQTQRKKKM